MLVGLSKLETAKKSTSGMMILARFAVVGLDQKLMYRGTKSNDNNRHTNSRGHAGGPYAGR